MSSTIESVIGGGSQARVALVEDQDLQITFAVKEYKTSNDPAFQAEVKSLMKLRDCAGVVKVCEVELPSRFHRSSIPLQYFPNGELFDYMAVDGILDERTTKAIFGQMMSILSDIHANKVIHRDLKPENVLLDSEFRPVLIDFGMSSVTEDWDQDGMLVGGCGTLPYMSPETINSRECGTAYGGFKADIWSMGCILFLMLTGNQCCGERGAVRDDWYLKQLSAGRVDKFWTAHERFSGVRLNEIAKGFLNRMLIVDPDRRATAVELLADPWLNDEVISHDEVATTLAMLKREILQRSRKTRFSGERSEDRQAEKQCRW